MIDAPSPPQGASQSPDAPPTDPGGRLLSGPPAYRPATPWKAVPALVVTAAIVAASLAAMGVVMGLALLLSGGVATQSAQIGHGLWSLALMQTVAVGLTLLASRHGGGASA